MNHKQKVKLARKLLTHRELIKGTSKFDSQAWNKRKEAIARRVKRREERSRLYVAKN